MDATFQPPSPIFLNFPPATTIRCRAKKLLAEDWSLTDRQERLPWWNQSQVHLASALFVGAGGLGSNQAKIHVQMGLGKLDLIDHDLVEDSNRNRQLFTVADVGRPKAHRVLKNLKAYAVYQSRLRGYYMTFEEWEQTCQASRYDVICCGVDYIPTMVAVARYALQNRTPAIFTNISSDGEACRIFIQRPGLADPCFACYMPAALDHDHDDRSCVPTPAIADILQVAVGFAARATVGEILGVPIGDYHARTITFSGIDIKTTVAKVPTCPVCGSCK